MRIQLYRISGSLKPAGPAAALIMILVFTAACHYYRLERSLDPDNAEWLSRIRYIITVQERRLFLDLPAEEKEAFKQEFWTKRDPDPYTEENEFKVEYYHRMEDTDELFLGEGRPGWMTDRGRIYILFGPPMDRYTSLSNSYGVCQETWFYGNFPVKFVDRNCTGFYELVSYNLTAIRSYNLTYMHELGQAQAKAQQTIRGQAGFFDFNLSAEAQPVRDGVFEGKIRIEIPLANVWFSAAGDILVTTLQVEIQLLDGRDQQVWSHEQSLRLEVNEEDIRTRKGLSHIEEIPVRIDPAAGSLMEGPNKIFVTLINKTGDARLRKVLEFRIKRLPGPA